MNDQIVLHENPDVFLNNSAKLRIDANYYRPIFFNLMNKFKRLASKKKDFQLTPLRNLLKQPITGGATPLGANYVDEGVKFIRVQNVRENHLVLDNVKYIEKRIHEKELKRSQLSAGDVLLTITGATYGIAAVVPEGIGEANMNQHSVKITVDMTKILPEYLSFFLNSRYGRIQTDRSITGSTRPALDYEAIKSIMILYPRSISEQEKIINQVKKYQNIANKHYTEYKSVVNSYSKKINEKLGINMPDESRNKFFTIKSGSFDRIDANFNTPYLKSLKKEIMKKEYRRLGTLIKIMPREKLPIREFYKLIELEDISEELGEVVNIKEVDNLGSDKVLIKEGEILISKLQPEKGKIIYIDSDLDGCVVSSELIPVMLTSRDTTVEYLKTILRTDIVLKQWEYEVTGASRARIGTTELKETLIPFPNKNIQEIIVKIGKYIIDSAKRSYSEYHQNLEKSKEEFIKSLQK